MKRIIICGGEPAGVGVELCLRLIHHQNQLQDTALIILADVCLLKQRAKELNQEPPPIYTIDEKIIEDNHGFSRIAQEAQKNQQLLVLPITVRDSVQVGSLNAKNARYVLDILSTAHQLCSEQKADGVLTLPIHKGVINQYFQQCQNAEIFQGHTEFFQHANRCEEVVMMLSCQKLSVALATTHIPIDQVASSICASSLEKKLMIIHQHYHLRAKRSPKIAVLGLNPHAGESGYMGNEEVQIIQPVIDKLRRKNLNLSDVMSADTAFIESNLHKYDCFFGMYHDQVLPIIKHLGFHQTTNITLGLPYPRVSVDHGTALDIADKGIVNDGSLRYSLDVLQQLIHHHGAS